MIKARLVFCLILLSLLNACASVISATTGNEGIQENPGTRSTGAVIDDSSIETRVTVNLNAAEEALREANIEVVSFNGTVLLVGQVPSQEMKNLATRVANSSSSRIKTVYNELEVAGDTSLLSRSNDLWLGSKLKTLLLVNGDTEGLRTKVVVENGTVYLMGLLTREEAEHAVDVVSNASGVVNVVRAFEYID